MDIRKVKKLIELLEESGIDELEIREGEESVRISRHSKQAFMQQPMYAAAPFFVTFLVPTTTFLFTGSRMVSVERMVCSSSTPLVSHNSKLTKG